MKKEIQFDLQCTFLQGCSFETLLPNFNIAVKWTCLLYQDLSLLIFVTYLISIEYFVLRKPK